MDPATIAMLITTVGVPATKYLLEMHANGQEWSKENSKELLAKINIPVENFEKGIVP